MLPDATVRVTYGIIGSSLAEAQDTPDTLFRRNTILTQNRILASAPGILKTPPHRIRVDKTHERRHHGLIFIERSTIETDIARLLETFLSATKPFGLESCAAGAWTGMGQGRAYRFFFNTWPADWLTLYNERQVFFDDPMILEAQRRMLPFLWSELQSERRLAEQSAAILQLALDYGWADGLVIPVHGPTGYQGVVSFASRQKLDLSAADISVLWVMALAIHARCRQTPGMGVGSEPTPRLTKREAECMRWVAAGKTEWETGQLLGIKPATVHFHVERVKRRLSATTRAAAVALLVLHGAL